MAGKSSDFSDIIRLGVLSTDLEPHFEKISTIVSQLEHHYQHISINPDLDFTQRCDNDNISFMSNIDSLSLSSKAIRPSVARVYNPHRGQDFDNYEYDDAGSDASDSPPNHDHRSHNHHDSSDEDLDNGSREGSYYSEYNHYSDNNEYEVSLQGNYRSIARIITSDKMPQYNDDDDETLHDDLQTHIFSSNRNNHDNDPAEDGGHHSKKSDEDNYDDVDGDLDACYNERSRTVIRRHYTHYEDDDANSSLSVASTQQTNVTDKLSQRSHAVMTSPTLPMGSLNTRYEGKKSKNKNNIHNFHHTPSFLGDDTDNNYEYSFAGDFPETFSYSKAHVGSAALYSMYDHKNVSHYLSNQNQLPIMNSLHGVQSTQPMNNPPKLTTTHHTMTPTSPIRGEMKQKDKNAAKLDKKLKKQRLKEEKLRKKEEKANASKQGGALSFLPLVLTNNPSNPHPALTPVNKAPNVSHTISVPHPSNNLTNNSSMTISPTTATPIPPLSTTKKKKKSFIFFRSKKDHSEDESEDNDDHKPTNTTFSTYIPSNTPSTTSMTASHNNTTSSSHHATKPYHTNIPLAFISTLEPTQEHPDALPTSSLPHKTPPKTKTNNSSSISNDYRQSLDSESLCTSRSHAVTRTAAYDPKFDSNPLQYKRQLLLAPVDPSDLLSAHIPTAHNVPIIPLTLLPQDGHKTLQTTSTSSTSLSIQSVPDVISPRNGGLGNDFKPKPISLHVSNLHQTRHDAPSSPTTSSSLLNRTQQHNINNSLHLQHRATPVVSGTGVDSITDQSSTTCLRVDGGPTQVPFWRFSTAPCSCCKLIGESLGGAYTSINDNNNNNVNLAPNTSTPHVWNNIPTLITNVTTTNEATSVSPNGHLNNSRPLNNNAILSHPSDSILNDKNYVANMPSPNHSALSHSISFSRRIPLLHGQSPHPSNANTTVLLSSFSHAPSTAAISTAQQSTQLFIRNHNKILKYFDLYNIINTYQELYQISTLLQSITELSTQPHIQNELSRNLLTLFNLTSNSTGDYLCKFFEMINHMNMTSIPNDNLNNSVINKYDHNVIIHPSNDESTIPQTTITTVSSSTTTVLTEEQQQRLLKSNFFLVILKLIFNVLKTIHFLSYPHVADLITHLYYNQQEIIEEYRAITLTTTGGLNGVLQNDEENANASFSFSPQRPILDSYGDEIDPMSSSVQTSIQNNNINFNINKNIDHNSSTTKNNHKSHNNNNNNNNITSGGTVSTLANSSTSKQPVSTFSSQSTTLTTHPPNTSIIGSQKPLQLTSHNPVLSVATVTSPAEPSTGGPALSTAGTYNSEYNDGYSRLYEPSVARIKPAVELSYTQDPDDDNHDDDYDYQLDDNLSPHPSDHDDEDSRRGSAQGALSLNLKHSTSRDNNGPKTNTIQLKQNQFVAKSPIAINDVRGVDVVDHETTKLNNPHNTSPHNHTVSTASTTITTSTQVPSFLPSLDRQPQSALLDLPTSLPLSSAISTSGTLSSSATPGLHYQPVSLNTSILLIGTPSNNQKPFNACQTQTSTPLTSPKHQPNYAGIINLSHDRNDNSRPKSRVHNYSTRDGHHIHQRRRRNQHDKGQINLQLNTDVGSHHQFDGDGDRMRHSAQLLNNNKHKQSDEDSLKKYQFDYSDIDSVMGSHSKVLTRNIDNDDDDDGMPLYEPSLAKVRPVGDEEMTLEYEHDSEEHDEDYYYARSDEDYEDDYDHDGNSGECDLHHGPTNDKFLHKLSKKNNHKEIRNKYKSPIPTQQFPTQTPFITPQPTHLRQSQANTINSESFSSTPTFDHEKVIVTSQQAPPSNNNAHALVSVGDLKQSQQQVNESDNEEDDDYDFPSEKNADPNAAILDHLYALIQSHQQPIQDHSIILNKTTYYLNFHRNKDRIFILNHLYQHISTILKSFMMLAVMLRSGTSSTSHAPVFGATSPNAQQAREKALATELNLDIQSSHFIAIIVQLYSYYTYVFASKSSQSPRPAYRRHQ